MNKDLYKVYDPDGNPLMFDSLRNLRTYFELSKEDSHKVFMKRCARVTAWGNVEIEVLHFFK